MSYLPEEITGNEDILTDLDVIRRLDHLERELEIAEDPDYPDPNYITYAEREELRDLRAFAADCHQNAEDWGRQVTLVSTGHLPAYLRSLAEEQYDGADFDAVPFSFIDWKEYAATVIEHAAEVTYRGTTYVQV